MKNLRDIFESNTDVDKELQIIQKLKPSQIPLRDDAYDTKWADYTWECPNVLSQLELDEDWELRYGGDPVGIRLAIRLEPNHEFDVNKARTYGTVSFAAVDKKGEECSADVYTENIYGSPTTIIKEIIRFMKIVCKDMESFRIFANHIWEPGYRQGWGTSLNEVCRKITGQPFGKNYN